MRKDAILSSKGQITLPKDLRDALGLKAGDDVTFTVMNGEAILTPKNLQFNELAGYLGRPPKGPATLEELEKAIATEGAASAMRALSTPSKGEAA